MQILYEDDDLVVVNKPPGIPTHATLDKKRPHLVQFVAEHLQTQLKLSASKVNSEVYIGEHHRLDRDTSGVILFSKAKRANANLTDQFKNHKILKTYVALTAPPLKPEKEWQIKNYLAESSKKNKMTSVRSGGKTAITDFCLLDANKNGALVQARPRTGRRHQIRAHLGEYNAPIVGDSIYGSSVPAPRIMLHALELKLTHPITQLELNIKAPIPQDFTQMAAKLGFKIKTI